MIHSNGVYHGRDYYYKFGEEEFQFTDKEIFQQKFKFQNEHRKKKRQI